MHDGVTDVKNRMSGRELRQEVASQTGASGCMVLTGLARRLAASLAGVDGDSRQLLGRFITLAGSQVSGIIERVDRGCYRARQG
jgi:hypothetical protein